MLHSVEKKFTFQGTISDVAISAVLDQGADLVVFLSRMLKGSVLKCHLIKNKQWPLLKQCVNGATI